MIVNLDVDIYSLLKPVITGKNSNFLKNKKK